MRKDHRFGFGGLEPAMTFGGGWKNAVRINPPRKIMAMLPQSDRNSVH
jgi:hypothetical protein